MRHLRTPNQNNNNLVSFKKQITNILKKINTFDQADRSEAVNYVQQFIDANNAGTASPESETQDETPDAPDSITDDEDFVPLTPPKKRVTARAKTPSKSVIRKSRKENSALVAPQQFVTQEEAPDVPNKEIMPLVPLKKKVSTRAKTHRKSVIRTKPRKEKCASAKPWLKCKVCGETKQTKISILKHMELHVGTPISCKVCCRAFNSRLSFDWHLTHLCKRKRVSVNKMFKCSDCPRKFSSSRYLNLHMDGHKRNNCLYCDTVLHRREHLVQHMLDVHQIKLERSNFNCSYCEKRFVKRQSLYYHLRQHLPDKIICMDCGEAMDSTELYNDHVKKHNEEKPWQCSQCKDRFSRRQQYIYHLKRHDRYKCLTCKENFASKAHAFKHKKFGHAVHGLEPNMHCPYCPAAFHRTLLLQMHIRKHKAVTITIRCKSCDKTFHTPYQYYKHCKTTLHDKNSPEINQLVCEICGKQFTKKYVLEQHLRRFHSNKRSTLSCKYCSFQTQFKPNMERHMKLHFSEDKQFMCDHCGKNFSNLASLNDHIKYTHLEEKQFKCSDCDKSFKRNSELVRHQSSHSDVRPHVCRLCTQSFKRRNHLSRHEKSVHSLVGRSKVVQRLKTDITGAVVPVIKEEKKAVKPKKSQPSKVQVIDPIYELADEQDNAFFGNTVSVINSVSLAKLISNEPLIPLDGFNQHDFWADKLNMEVEKANSVVYNGDAGSLPHMSSLNGHASDLQAFNIVDQLVKSLLPSKELPIVDCQDYNEYPTDSAIEYTNLAICSNTKEADMLTNERLINDVTW